MDLSWIVSFPPGVSVLPGPEGELLVSGSGARLALRRLAPATRGALGRLAHPGGQLGEVLGPLHGDALARFAYWLGQLAARGWLRVTATADGRPLASADPAPSTFRLNPPPLPEGRVVLSRFAYLHRDGSDLVLESPLSDGRIVLHDDRATGLLHVLAGPVRAADLPLASVVALLHQAGLLVGEGEELGFWEFHDLLFHARSRGRGAGPLGATFLHDVPPPPALRPAAGGEVVALARPDLAQALRDDPPLAQVMERRRSIRTYGAEPIHASQLGEFLYRVARVTRQEERDVGPARLEVTARPYPSGGSLYELEVYPVVRACRGLAAGLYHYDPLGHRLGRLSGMTPEVEGLLAGAALAADIAADTLQVLLVLAARFARVQWKYSGLAYALTLKNVGVLYQSMYLAATAMRLAPCALGTGDSDLFARASGNDGRAESSVGEFLLGSLGESEEDDE